LYKMCFVYKYNFILINVLFVVYKYNFILINVLFVALRNCQSSAPFPSTVRSAQGYFYYERQSGSAGRSRIGVSVRSHPAHRPHSHLNPSNPRNGPNVAVRRRSVFRSAAFGPRSKVSRSLS
jgi:hypothetical protein